MRKILYIISSVLLLFTSLWSCTSSSNIVYFQDIDTVKEIDNEAAYITRIMKDDLLQIIVSGPDKSVVQPFNLTLNESNNIQGSIEGSVIAYLVDAEGYIDFPILGRIYVEGMTRMELISYLTTRIKEYVKEPVVVVNFKNYKITILGDVAKPGSYRIDSERTTLLQALGLAGDLTITAKRKNVLLIRDIDGVQTPIRIDLTSKYITSSPYFYLHQNDVLYVEPSSKRIAQGTIATSVWSLLFSVLSTTMSVVTFYFTLKSK